jgi:hypothetical protein
MDVNEGKVAMIRSVAALSAVCACAWLTRPDIAALTAALGGGSREAALRSGFDAALAPVAGVAVFGCLVWLGAALAVLLAGEAPGRFGAICRAAGAYVAPLAIRRLACVALGVGVAVAPATAFAAPTSQPSAPVLSAQPALTAPEWPMSTQPAPAWPTSPAPASPTDATPTDMPPTDTTPPETAQTQPEPDDPRAADQANLPPGAQPTPGAATVRPGDTLWSIAAATLPADSSDGAIAAAWPAWYAANRDAIGDDPSLIRPGQVLQPPPEGPISPSSPLASADPNRDAR